MNSACSDRHPGCFFAPAGPRPPRGPAPVPSATATEFPKTSRRVPTRRARKNPSLLNTVPASPIRVSQKWRKSARVPLQSRGGRRQARTGISPMQLRFASIHGLLDPSSRAAIATRELLELLSGRGSECRAFTAGVLDDEEETSLEQALGTLGLSRRGARRRSRPKWPWRRPISKSRSELATEHQRRLRRPGDDIPAGLSVSLAERARPFERGPSKRPASSISIRGGRVRVLQSCRVGGENGYQ